jgi:hypothetical protein
MKQAKPYICQQCNLPKFGENDSCPLFANNKVQYGGAKKYSFSIMISNEIIYLYAVSEGSLRL